MPKAIADKLYQPFFLSSGMWGGAAPVSWGLPRIKRLGDGWTEIYYPDIARKFMHGEWYSGANYSAGVNEKPFIGLPEDTRPTDRNAPKLGAECGRLYIFH